MKKVFFTGLVLCVFGFSNAQSMHLSDKGRDLLVQMEKSLEIFYGHDMILTPTYEKGMREYAHEQAGVPLPETAFEGNAHFHTAVHFDPALFEQIDNNTLAGLLTPDSTKDNELNSMLTTINPNRFYIEQYTINESLYIVLALDRPFNYTTWKAEE